MPQARPRSSGPGRWSPPSPRTISSSSRHQATGEGVLIVDELGQMELYSEAFIQAIQRLLVRDVPVVATVHARPIRLPTRLGNGRTLSC